MNQDLKISVIIPVYQVAKYLRECIDSVIAQDYKNIEIILIDDGSSDESPEICDQYEKKYTSIKVIHKANGGLSDARNTGIKIATGDYITFLDGDDFWNDINAITRLVKRLNSSKADVLNFSYTLWFEETDKKINYFEQVSEMSFEMSDKKMQLDYLTKNHLYIASACNKLIKRELFSNNLFFLEDVYSEDVEWCARLLLQAKSMDFVCENFYFYRQRSGSIRHTITDKKCRDLCNHIITCFKLIETCEEPEKEALLGYTAYQYGTFFIIQAQAENEQNECLALLDGYRWILAYHYKNKKILCLNCACKLIGYKKVCRLIRRFYRNKNRCGECR